MKKNKQPLPLKEEVVFKKYVKDREYLFDERIF